MSDLQIPIGEATLEGILSIPPGASGVVLFAHGSGSSRRSRRNQYIADVIRKSGTGTLLFDLLTREEEMQDMGSGHLRFDIAFLARRLTEVTQWLLSQHEARDFGVGYFGSSTGAAAALVAAGGSPGRVDAIVSRGGRPDLAAGFLAAVRAPTLFIVGEGDRTTLELNRQALTELQCPKQLEVVPRATHLFEEAGTLEAAARLAADWFHEHLRMRNTRAPQHLAS